MLVLPDLELMISYSMLSYSRITEIVCNTLCVGNDAYYFYCKLNHRVSNAEIIWLRRLAELWVEPKDQSIYLSRNAINTVPDTKGGCYLR